MALTNFALLTNEQLTMWARDTWSAARNLSFLDKFTGTGPNALVQRITELKKDKKGARAVITLVADLVGDGVAGDRTLEGNEEGMVSHDQVIRVDLLRHANKNEGVISDQKSVVTFRDNSKNVLAYWLSDRIDQLAFLTMAGMDYGIYPNGLARSGSNLPFLEFASDVTPPSAQRHFRWDSVTKSLAAGNTALITAADRVTWATLVELQARAKEKYIRGIKSTGGEEVYHVFLNPRAMKDLKLDPDYMANLRNAQPRSDKNSLFTGSSVKLDGLHLHDFRHVPSTIGTAVKWGALNAIDGSRIILAGAQALGLADIGVPEWTEKSFDFGNQHAISYGKVFGFKKPQFASIYETTTAPEDFGLMVCDVAIG